MKNKFVPIVAVLLAILIGAGILLFSSSGQEPRTEDRVSLPDREVVISTTEMRLSNQSSLNVMKLSGMMNVRVPVNRIWPIPDTFMSVRMPFTVDYRIILNEIRKNDISWDDEKQELRVEVPDVSAAKPNIDEGAIQVTSPPGIIVTTAEIQRARIAVSRGAEFQASKEAYTLERLNQARDRARIEIGNLLRGPLERVGVRRPDIVVTFPYERTGPRERWDQSRSVDQVLTNRY